MLTGSTQKKISVERGGKLRKSLFPSLLSNAANLK
jgi:hypothetical protein